ncbi:hypothetical protein GCM10027287_29950 [Bordetella muralis]
MQKTIDTTLQMSQTISCWNHDGNQGKRLWQVITDMTTACAGSLHRRPNALPLQMCCNNIAGFCIETDDAALSFLI